MEKVFGIGLNKTGTTTLGTCFKLLGYRHVTVRRDLLAAYRAGDLDAVFRVSDAHDSFEDWPWPLMYRELNERYGASARFILTTRKSPEKWLSSLTRYSLFTNPVTHCRKLAYGYNYPHYAQAEHLSFYDRHNREVRAYFDEIGASDRLRALCWENGDGWDELCAFLGKEKPDAPFPRDNVATGGRKSGYETPNRLLAAVYGRLHANPMTRRFS